MFNNLETSSEFYGMDTKLVQFTIQDFYYKFQQILEIMNNGFSIAALWDIEFKIGLPYRLQTFRENLEMFKTLWMGLDHRLELLYENIETHHKNAAKAG